MSLVRHPMGGSPPDPNSSQSNSGRHGGSGDRHRRGEFASVISYQVDTNTATIKTERGRTLNGVPRVRSTPGELAPLAAGTEVLVSYDYGSPIIMGIMTAPAATGGTPYSATDTDGFGGQGDNRDLLRTGGNYRQAREPTDLMPGDYGYVGDDGNMMAVLAGGSNVIKSGPLSQIRTHQINDLIELICRNYRQITDMGEWTVSNNDGRINLQFRGASDQRSEAGPDEEKWTIRLDLGSEGDMFNFELTTPNGQVLFRLHVDAEGHAEMFGLNGVDLLSGSRTGGRHSEEHTGDSTRRVSGNRTATTGGDERREISGNSTSTVTSDSENNVGNDYRLQALRDVAIGAGRNMNVAVQGGEGASALTFDIESGNWTVDLGGPTSPTSGYELNTFSGDINFNSTLGGNFSVSTPLGNVKTKSLSAKFVTGLPDSVVLGGEVLTSHLVKFEQLQAHLIQLYALLDVHTHVHAGTALALGVLPVAGLSGPPLIPLSALLTPTILLLRSLVAGVSS